MKGKLIVIEGTDCSGKETQSNLLIEKLKNDGVRIKMFSFPNYNSPTGKIIGGPYLGKSYISEGWFPEGAPNVDPKVSALYYAADRLYNIKEIENSINDGYIVILDRYVYSNMAHQGCKVLDKSKRNDIYNWLEELEFGLLKLPIPDIKLFLHMPSKYTKILKQNREESLDQHELNDEYISNAEAAYLELTDKYNFKTISCVDNNKIKSIDDIHLEICNYLKNSVLSSFDGGKSNERILYNKRVK